jgi:5-methylcytosine-specific restriction endonuclease McrA
MARPAKHDPVTKTCPECSKSFLCTKVYEIEKQKFCSVECRLARMEKGGPRVARIKRKCKTCGKIMLVLPCHLSTKFYCSNKCRATGHAETMTGAGNPQWDGGNDTYWKQKARERDGRCMNPGCPDPNVGGHQLHAHHIHPGMMDGADSLENLISLCNVCHQSIETMFYRAVVRLLGPAKLKAAVDEVRSHLGLV